MLVHAKLKENSKDDEDTRDIQLSTVEEAMVDVKCDTFKRIA
jgi:hypothetical protein